jgi:chromate transporter
MMEHNSISAENSPEVSLRDLCRVFGTIGISSFGGGSSGWMYRELVERRLYISSEDFLAGLALARTMPGPNSINLAIWIGYRLRRSSGALTAFLSVLAGPLVIIICCAIAYQRLSHSSTVHQILIGIAASALGLSLSVGIKAWSAASKTPFYAVIALLTFVGVAILHWPILPIVAVLGSISVAWAFYAERPDAR